VVPDATGGSGGFDKNFQTALEKLIKASGGKLSIKSGYRTPERQAQLWAKKLKEVGGDVAKARKWVAPPGKSNHNRGLAADLGFSGPDAVNWAHANAAKYGLVFPLANENWHIEPVGARSKKH
jgi:LAS superfamily LD-carboxypeptidase LdcB